jgi:CcmD family protein
VQSLPEPSAPPRTLRAYWHVFAAFAFAWLLILGYAISLARRFRRLEQQVNALGGERPAV